MKKTQCFAVIAAAISHVRVNNLILLYFCPFFPQVFWEVNKATTTANTTTTKIIAIAPASKGVSCQMAPLAFERTCL
jgi:hypothetical protein